MMCGDWHGKLDLAAELVEKARRKRADVIVVMGDFGYWEHWGPNYRPRKLDERWNEYKRKCRYNDGIRFLDRLDHNLKIHDLWLVFIDGNHENHQMLRALYGPGGTKHRPQPCGWHVRDRIVYAPRGHRWEWNGVSFLAMGGAYSVDREGPPGDTWWPEETITDAEMEAGIAAGPTDVLLCHDAPLGVPDLPGDNEHEKMAFPQTVDNRRRLDRVARHTLPKHVFHGHYHTANRSHVQYPFELDGQLHWTDTTVHSLAEENRPRAWELFKIPEDLR